jgi:hypothetical protein
MGATARGARQRLLAPEPDSFGFAQRDRCAYTTRKGWTVSKPACIAAALTALAAAVPGLQASEEPAPDTFVSLKLEGACDEQNQRLWLTNSHTYKTVAATVRWRAAGGKDLTDRFYSTPNSVREIGCAAEGEILEASFAEF